MSNVLLKPINPWLIHDVQKAADSALANRWILPTGLIDMSGGIEWGCEFVDGGNSKRLWLHSLPFVDDLFLTFLKVGESSYFQHAIFLLNHYFDWVDESQSNFKITWCDEHAVANRSCVMASIIFNSKKGNILIPYQLLQKVERHLIECAHYLATPAHYVNNNHGVMMDRSLLQITLLLDNVSDESLLQWRRLALTRIEMMLDLTFDKYGCCTENSPAYQFINIDLFESVENFLELHGFKTLAKIIRLRLDNARYVASIMLRSDYTVPMIGDSTLQSSFNKRDNISPNTTGTGFYPDSGFYIHKSESLHLTMKCGGKTHSHRHLDDTSITCRYLENDLIVDCGLYNYDSNDVFRKYFFSSEAHSGIFFDACSSIERIYIYPEPSAVGRMLDFSNKFGRQQCDCESTYFEDSSIKRSLSLFSPNLIYIEDLITCKNPQSWKLQFNFHPECTVELLGSTVVVRRNNVGCELRYLGPEIFSIRDAYYSVSFGKKVISKQVYISSYANTAQTLIRFFGAANSEVLYSEVINDVISNSYGYKISSNEYQIDPCSWIVSSGTADIKYYSGCINIKSNEVGGSCYIQSGPGKFERVNPKFSYVIPFNSTHANLIMNCIVKNEINTFDLLNVFFIQFDSNGVVVVNDQFQFDMKEGFVSVNEIILLNSISRYWMVAVKIYNSFNDLIIHPVRVVFPELYNE